MKTAVFQVRLEATPEAEINPFHLAEEIQAYLCLLYTSPSPRD